MATVILLRHGRSTANGSGILAGRSAGVGLDERGAEQARALVPRLAEVPLSVLVSSPLQRCQETLDPLLRDRGVRLAVEEGLSEVDYGEWTGRSLGELTDEPLWGVVQQHPSAAVFPGGEGLAQMQARAVAAVRAWDAWVTAEHGPGAVWLACSHGDVIKSVLVDALAGHLDGFQRIVVEPCSVSAVRYTQHRPFLLRMNDTAEVAGLVPPPEEQQQSSDAVVGGSTGSGA